MLTCFSESFLRDSGLAKQTIAGRITSRVEAATGIRPCIVAAMVPDEAAGLGWFAAVT